MKDRENSLGSLTDGAFSLHFRLSCYRLFKNEN